MTVCLCCHGQRPRGNGNVSKMPQTNRISLDPRGPRNYGREYIAVGQEAWRHWCLANPTAVGSRCLMPASRNIIVHAAKSSSPGSWCQRHVVWSGSLDTPYSAVPPYLRKVTVLYSVRSAARTSRCTTVGTPPLDAENLPSTSYRTTETR